VGEALARGETSVRVEAKLDWPDGTTKWVAVRAEVFLDSGVPSRVIGVAMDVTDRRRWEDTLLITAAELQHRVKNTLAIVQSMASQTFRREADYKEAIATFQGRLRALATATELITRNNWTAVDVADLVAEVVSPFNAKGRFAFSGDRVAIDSRDANTLAIALHELCTNAVKYGALSNEAGRVVIGWTLEDSGEYAALQWTEINGPTVVPPTTQGFGTKLLGSGAFASGGPVELSYPPTGLKARLSVRVAEKFDQALNGASIALDRIEA
jgi:two-component sensor histidine kinase